LRDGLGFKWQWHIAFQNWLFPYRNMSKTKWFR
jgi:hypothetical protein